MGVVGFFSTHESVQSEEAGGGGVGVGQDAEQGTAQDRPRDPAEQARGGQVGGRVQDAGQEEPAAKVIAKQVNRSRSHANHYSIYTL